MIKDLTYEQRKFLEYIQKNHDCLGWNITVPCILDSGKYDPDFMRPIMKDWAQLCSGTGSYLIDYGKPLKYLK